MKTDRHQFYGQNLIAFIASDNDEAAAVVKKLVEDADFNGLIVGNIKTPVIWKP